MQKVCPVWQTCSVALFAGILLRAAHRSSDALAARDSNRENKFRPAQGLSGLANIGFFIPA
jgi:hypothetical protein